MMTSLLLAALTSPLAWQQIDFDQKLLLNQPVTLNEKINLKTGTELTVTDVMPLDQIRVLSYKMKITPCSRTMKNETSDMIIIDELYGAQLEKNCVLNVFLEFQDLNKTSIFLLKDR